MSLLIKYYTIVTLVGLATGVILWWLQKDEKNDGH